DPNPNANIIAKEGFIESTVNVDGTDLRDFWLFIYSAEGYTGYEYNKAINIAGLSNVPSLDSDGSKKWAGAVKVENSTSETDVVKVPLYPGKYKIYVVANLSQYVGDLTSKDNKGNLVPVGENALKAKVLAFTSSHIDSQVLKPGYLPMICMDTDVDEADNGVINVIDDDVKELSCNLNFLCAKVRYTVLFDNTKDTGFSYAQFGDKYLLDFGTKNEVANVCSNTHILSGGTLEAKYFGSGFTIPLASKDYPTASGTSYPTTNDKTSDLPAHIAAWKDTERQRAWQGTIYLPENPSTTEASLTKLHLDGMIGDADCSYDIPLIKGANGQTDTEALLRGKFYDLTILAKNLKTTEIKFSVDDWNPLQLVYDLHGPYFLHIEETKVNIVPGETYKMWYDTNAPELIGHSPQVEVEIDGVTKKVDLYKWEQKDGTFNVWINPEVKSKYFDDIKANSSQYNFFHIQAGNIYKKVEVFPFELELFLSVDPDDITINVREQIASFTYSGTYDVVIKTNYDKFTITPKNWKEIFGSSTDINTNTSDILYLADSKGNRVPFNTPITTDASGVMNYKLYYKGLNDGNTFWTEDPHKLQLSVTAATEDNSKVSEPETVKINTYPSKDDYIIHVKLPTSWTSPHIYVYQCLEFPADTQDPDRANKPLATSSTGLTAALEYSFTGKIAFKGWNVGGYNNPNSPTGTTTNGFYYFTGDDTWDPSVPNPKHYYELDFCEAFRADSDCGSCKSDQYNRLWPGIRMQWEKDATGGKWWKFKLTGVATPGKALIMWANGHSGNGFNDRYPYAGEGWNDPGVPLFDYPNREGWFDITTTEGIQNGFMPSDPEDIDNNNNNNNNNARKYRIYFQKYYNGNEVQWLHVWIDGGAVLIDKKFGTDYPGNGDYKYVDFEHTGDLQSTLKYKLSYYGGDANLTKTLNDFKKDGDRYSVHIWDGKIYAGNP
ncbi:MAG: hypothetical protein K2J82_08985, partial [Muribaculaceae bacterium]|nr:hypothetical protein [Muribaculaceae bacterium]